MSLDYRMPMPSLFKWTPCLAIVVWMTTLSGIARSADDATYPLLRESIDPEFHEAIARHTRKEFQDTRRELIAQKRVSITIVDITDLHHPRVAEANGDHMLYAASLPKIAILLGAYVQAERGELVIDEAMRASLTRMIRNSSNRDATEVLNRVGFEALAEILQSDRFRLYDPEYGGGLWVGRDYGGGRVWRRDPINHISHGASAMQVARFFYLLATNRLSTPQYNQEMLEILSNPAIKHKFVRGLMETNPNARIARKSGTWRDFHADGGIVDSEHGRYIIVAIGQHPDGGRDLVRLMGAVERAFQKTEGIGR